MKYKAVQELRYYRDLMSQFNLNYNQLAVYLALIEDQGEVYRSELVDYLEISASAYTKIIQALLNRGLIEKSGTFLKGNNTCSSYKILGPRLQLRH